MDEIQSQPVTKESPVETSVSEAVIEDRIFAALSYISVLFVVPWVLRSDNEDIKFHVRQGVVLFGAEVVVWFALAILDAFLAAILSGGEIWLVRMLGALAWILFMAVSLAGVYFASVGKRWPLPVIGRLARRIKV